MAAAVEVPAAVEAGVHTVVDVTNVRTSLL
jgi:hypothetical protein